VSYGGFSAFDRGQRAAERQGSPHRNYGGGRVLSVLFYRHTRTTTHEGPGSGSQRFRELYNSDRHSSIITIDRDLSNTRRRAAGRVLMTTNLYPENPFTDTVEPGSGTGGGPPGTIGNEQPPTGYTRGIRSGASAARRPALHLDNDCL